MSAQMRAESVPVDDGERVRARRERLGMDKKRLAAAAGISRETLAAVEAGHSHRQTTMAALDRALSDAEAEVGITTPVETGRPRGYVEDEHGGIVRIRLEGVFGANAAVVEAPADNPDALAAALDIIMRRMQGEKPAEAPEEPADPNGNDLG